MARTAISGQELASVCPEYEVSGRRLRAQGQREAKTVGFWKVSERNRWEEMARTAISGQELAMYQVQLAVR